MKAMVERENMFAALKRVKASKGAAGVGGMTVAELSARLREHSLRIKEELLVGRYMPKPVRPVEIPKFAGTCKEG